MGETTEEPLIGDDEVSACWERLGVKITDSLNLNQFALAMDELGFQWSRNKQKKNDTELRFVVYNFVELTKRSKFLKQWIRTKIKVLQFRCNFCDRHFHHGIEISVKETSGNTKKLVAMSFAYSMWSLFLCLKVQIQNFLYIHPPAHKSAVLFWISWVF